MEMNRTNIKQNNTIDFINLNPRLLEKLLINICTLTSASFTIIACLVIIISITVIYNSPSYKKSIDASLLLTCNTCFAIICSSTMLIVIQLANISGDRHVSCLEWFIVSGCHIRGYLQIVFIDSLYLSYVLQAGYRLFRIVFNDNKCLRTFIHFSYYIISQWTISFIVIVPTLFTGKELSSSIVYLPEHFYCQIPVTSLLSITYSILVVYILPICCMCIIYIWIIIYVRDSTIRHHQSTLTWKLRRQNKRDALLTKRICIIIILLLTLGIPSSILYIRFMMSGNLHWIFYRLSGMIISMFYAFICLSSIYVTPQIYLPIRTKFGDSKYHTSTREEYISSIILNKTQRKPVETVVRKMSSIHMIELDII